jgi:predicted TIM-barrel fold metal-dependent hydrolase
MTITDAQVHLFPLNTPERPWITDGRNVPSRASFTAEEMLGHMTQIGVDRAVIVPPGVAGEDNSYALECCAKYPGRFAVMGRIDPYAPDTLDRLETWRSQPGMLGVRMSGRWPTTDNTVIDTFEDPALEGYWSACERLGIPLMVLTRNFPSKLDSLATRHPALPLIVDHMAAVDGANPAERYGAIDDLLALAKHRSIYIKVSNGPNRSDEAFPFADVQPYCRRVYDTFGPLRMIWAADITQLTKNTYEECLRFYTEGQPYLSADDKAWILNGSAAEALDWS